MLQVQLNFQGSFTKSVQTTLIGKAVGQHDLAAMQDFLKYSFLEGT